jgi:uncharacterized membrane protein YhhN
MLNTLIIIIAIPLLAVLLYFEKKSNTRAVLPVKTSLSLLFIITALVQPHPLPGYFYLLLIGLIFCLGGDVFLALPGEKTFLCGLVSFLLGHVFYVIAFFSVAGLNLWTWAGLGISLVLSGGIYFWLRPHLGSMNLPVLFYVIVITAMVVGACTVLGDRWLTASGKMLVFWGAISFYFSDVFVARDRFLRPEFLNRLIGLPLYYCGQFLLAFSVGFLTI